MKILHMHTSMRSGGIEAMICGLANSMAESVSVSVCSIFTPKDDDVFWNKLSNAVNRISLGKSKKGFSLSEVFKIYRLISKGGFHVVNLHGCFYYYMLSVFLLHRKIKFFYTVHSDAIMENSGWDKRLFRLKKLFFKLGWIRPITISAASKESFSKLYDINSRLIYNGVTAPCIVEEDRMSNFRISQNTKLFIHAGRLSKEKNQLVLCKVFKTLIDKGYDVVLVIAGGVANLDIYKSIEPYFCNRIIYIGERNDISQLMYNSDAMCLPSIWEGLPVTLLEAFSVGCIPICSPVGGIPNVVVDGVNGFLSEGSDENDYLIAVERFLEQDPMKISEMKLCCSNSFKKFNINNTAKEYLAYYKE